MKESADPILSTIFANIRYIFFHQSDIRRSLTKDLTMSIFWFHALVHIIWRKGGSWGTLPENVEFGRSDFLHSGAF